VDQALLAMLTPSIISIVNIQVAALASVLEQSSIFLTGVSLAAMTLLQHLVLVTQLMELAVLFLQHRLVRVVTAKPIVTLEIAQAKCQLSGVLILPAHMMPTWVVEACVIPDRQG
jgi:hypothetical protein